MHARRATFERAVANIDIYFGNDGQKEGQDSRVPTHACHESCVGEDRGPTVEALELTSHWDGLRCEMFYG